MQMHEFGPLTAQVMKTLDQQGEIYNWSTGGTQITWAVLAVVVPAFVALLIARAALTSPYELRIGNAGLLTLVSVASTRNVAAAEIARIVRHELRGDRRLDHFEVVLRRGSVELPGREDIFERLLALNPAARVEAKEYDPPD